MDDSSIVDLAAGGLTKWLGHHPDGSARLLASLPGGVGRARRGARVPLAAFDGGDEPVVEIKDRHSPPGVFCVLAFDPDAPRPCYLHWLLADAPAVDPARGAALVPWSPPAPPGGVHRYCLALFRVPPPAPGGRGRPATPTPPKGRTGFQPKSFADGHGMTLADATWFTVSAADDAAAPED